MSISLRDAGVWKGGVPWVKDGGVWKPVQQGWVKDAGIWKEIFASGPPPFTLSGTFATNLDGWTGTGVWDNSVPRTPPGHVSLLASTYYIERVIPKATGGSRTISVSIWHRIQSALNTQRTLSYRIGSGSFVTLATVTDASTTYAQMSGSFDNPGDDDVTIRIARGSGLTVYLDDWEISGS